MSRVWAMWGVLGVCLAVFGCQGSTPAVNPTDPENSTVADGKPGESKDSGEQAIKPQLTVLEGIDSWEGTWVLAPTIQRASRNLWLLRLVPGENGTWTIQDLANEPLIGTISGVEVKINGDQIRLVAKIDNPKAQVKTGKVNFEGTLREGQVFGNMILGDTVNLMPARLIPTDAESLAEYADSLPERGLSQFEKALSDPDPSHGLWKVAKSYPHSALALDVYSSLFAQIEKWNFTEEEVRAAAKDYAEAVEHWGARLQSQLKIDAGLSLANARKFVDLAEEFLNAGEALAAKESPTAEMKLKAGRLNVRIARGLVAIKGKDPEAAAAANTDLQAVLIEQPYHPELILPLAEHAEKTQQTDAAIKYYLTLVGLPMMERMSLAARLGAPAGDRTPRSALETLWEEKHGSLDGLEAALEETYDREIAAILTKLRESAPELPPADAGNRTLLVEVFTGASCDPCVALDLALEGALHDLPPTKVIQLTYHQHLPGPDPLTSMDGEGRGKFYNIQGTPSVFMNGAPIERLGGPFFPSLIEQNYYALRAPVDFFLKLSTDVTIEPKAEVVDGQLKVNISVTGVPDGVIGKARLRVAVVEDHVAFVAPNGIRHHRMVVRTMLGGSGGKSANKDQVLEYGITMPVAELKARQITYLMQYEHGKRIQFPAKPVDMKVLQLVAFVQNDATKEVLQAAATPILGEWIYPEFIIKSTDEIPLDPAQSDAQSSDEQPTEKPAEPTPEK